ncbi:MAG: hypothetical protein LBF56_03235 [Holosporales bacterium]|jgi:hypothetical protein|nr:hypothetical protein [Holosporales bacterium]
MLKKLLLVAAVALPGTSAFAVEAEGQYYESICAGCGHTILEDIRTQAQKQGTWVIFSHDEDHPNLEDIDIERYENDVVVARCRITFTPDARNTNGGPFRYVSLNNNAGESKRMAATVVDVQKAATETDIGNLSRETKAKIADFMLNVENHALPPEPKGTN